MTIPADIENEAVRLCEAHLEWPTTELVMKAIHAERERCAEIARAYFDGKEAPIHDRSAAYMISVAILSGATA